MTVWLELLVIVGLTALNGFFAMAEMAVVSSRSARLQAMVEDGRRGAQRALDLAGNPARFLSGVQVGITAISILSGAYGGATLGTRLGDYLDTLPLFQPRGHEIAVALVVVGITILSLVAGELIPKRIALADPEPIAARLARPLQFVVLAARPIVWILEQITHIVLAALRIPENRRDTVTEEEVKIAIAEGTQSGAIAKVEQKMIHGVLALADTPVSAVMTPRPDVQWIDLDDDPQSVARDIADCPYSRIVVARGGDLGRPLGVVQKKDLVGDLLAGRELNIEKHLLQPSYVPETIPVLRLLELFRHVSVHLAFVVDEYGDFLGLTTVNDIFSAVAGHLPEETGSRDGGMRQRPDGSWLVDGRTPAGEVAATLGIEIEGDFHTAAGLALDRLARIPNEGESFRIGRWRADVIDMDGKRIDKLLFSPVEEPAEETEE
jgi:putative hemolysin